MGSSSARSKGRIFEGLVAPDYLDFKDDSRLMRQLMRRKIKQEVIFSATKQNSKPMYSGNAPPEQTAERKKRDIEVICLDDDDDDDESDSDYVKYMMEEDTGSCTDSEYVDEVVVDDDEYDSDYLIFLGEEEESCTDSMPIDEFGKDGNGYESSYAKYLRNWFGDGKSSFDARSMGDDEHGEDKDPDYKAFLENVKEYGNSYLLEVFAGSEMLNPVVYEKDYEPQDRLGLGTEKPSKKSCDANGKTKVKRTLKGNEGNGETMRRQNSMVKRNANVKCSDPVSGRRQRCSSRRYGLEATCLIEDDSDDNAESDGETSYSKYLNGVMINDKEVVPVGQSDDKPLRMDKGENSDSDIEVIEVDKYPNRILEHTSFIPTRHFNEPIDVENWTGEGSLAASRSQFREKLMVTLKEPYDQKEYKRLLKSVLCHKRIVRERILRSGAISYKSDSVAESYLELYPGFAEKINLAKGDRPRTLNLLRGFFYWLQNLTQEEAFRPWLDPACSEVLMPSESPEDDSVVLISDEDEE